MLRTLLGPLPSNMALPRHGRYGGGGWGYPGGWWWGGPTYSGNIPIGELCPDCYGDKGDRQEPPGTLPPATPFPPSVNDQVTEGVSRL